MRKIVLLICLMCSLCGMAQVTFTCDSIGKDLARWGTIVNKKDNVKWANAIKDHGMYKLNEDGSLEYVYIIQASDSIDIKKLRQTTFDFICYYFNMNNESRASMIANSEEDGVYFQGKVMNVGSFNSLTDVNRIHANIIFNIKFKGDRIRFSVKIQDYQVIKVGGYGAILQNNQVFINNTYPLNQNSDHKKSYAMAFINSNCNCLNYANDYLNYLTKHNSKPSQKVDENW